ncbi:hypothetical protein JCM10207_000920 [Rhodosporidiobolus poonsookiae]
MSESDSHNIDLPPWVKLDITNVSLALAILGAYLTTINQISYLLKERLLLSSALVALCVGIAFGPIGTDWLSPGQWTGHSETAQNSLTFQICRIVIGIQVMFAGIDLPGAYLRREALSLTMLLLPVMVCAWFTSALFIWLLVKGGITYLEALAISACVTPTDPILANAIVKGKYAEKYVPQRVRDVLSAESGANDGLGYPFLFLAVNLMQRYGQHGSINAAVQHWVVTTWLYQIGLACVLGTVIGYVARKTLKFAHGRGYIDHESFLAYGVGLALFTLGIVGVLGSDDVLACFVAGNSLTWHDFYRREASEEDTFQGVIDNLLDTATFLYIGAIIPWSDFTSEYLTPWRLVVLAICILLVRRLPFVLAFSKLIPALEGKKESLFAGWFGPIGVSALYYAILARETIPENRTALHAIIFPVVIFIAMSSTIVHGITIPVSTTLPKAMSRTYTTMSTASRKNSSFRTWFRSTNDVEDGTGTFTPADVSRPASRPMSRHSSIEEMQQVDGSGIATPAAAQVKPSREALRRGNSSTSVATAGKENEKAEGQPQASRVGFVEP